MPEKARWQFLQDRAKQPEIGKWLDEAMDAIEKINPSLKGVLPKIYADPELNKQRLGEIIDLIGTIGFNQRVTRPRIFWAGCMNIFSVNSPMPKGRREGSSRRRQALSKCWSPCSNPTRTSL